MLVAYDSRTGNVRRFIRKLDLPSVQIDEAMTLDEPFVLITYTTGFGEVPPKVLSFMKNNHKQCIGVSASGNRNWGECYGRSADIIARMYGIPVWGKFELAGTSQDVEKFKQGFVSYNEEMRAVASY